MSSVDVAATEDRLDAGVAVVAERAGLDDARLTVREPGRAEAARQRRLIRVHQHGANGDQKGGLSDCMGRSRGGNTAKIHAIVDCNDLPIAFEQFFSKLKHFRAAATRSCCHYANYLASVQLAALRIWMRFNEYVT